MTRGLARPGWPELPEQVTWRHRIAFTELFREAEPPGPLVKRALASAWG
jgi:hypothetical protein